LDLFEEFAQKLIVRPQRAQILLALPEQQSNVERALSVLSSQKITWEESKVLSKADPAIILILLSSENLSEAVKLLSEAGYTRLKGLDSQRDISPQISGG
jgi:hypothetical protein